jgi:hypothetical protein
MPNPCTICPHRRRKKIEKDRARGRSLRWLARKYDLAKSAVHRHLGHADSKPGLLDQILGPEPRAPGRPRGNPDKTKPYRWKPGQSGNPRGRPKGRKSYSTKLSDLMDSFDR